MRKTVVFALGGLALLVMLVGDGVAAAWALGWLKSEPSVVTKTTPGARKLTRVTKHKGKIEFVDTGKMVVTLPSSASADGSQGYLQIEISFATYNKNAAAVFQSYKPMVKASLISAVMEDGSQLATGSPAAKRHFAQTALAIADKVVSRGDAKLPAASFAGAYITDFILQ